MDPLHLRICENTLWSGSGHVKLPSFIFSRSYTLSSWPYLAYTSNEQLLLGQGFVTLKCIFMSYVKIKGDTFI